MDEDIKKRTTVRHGRDENIRKWRKSIKRTKDS
jgi:hypothetical protein